MELCFWAASLGFRVEDLSWEFGVQGFGSRFGADWAVCMGSVVRLASGCAFTKCRGNQEQCKRDVLRDCMTKKHLNPKP